MEKKKRKNQIQKRKIMQKQNQNQKRKLNKRKNQKLNPNPNLKIKKQIYINPYLEMKIKTLNDRVKKNIKRDDNDDSSSENEPFLSLSKSFLYDLDNNKQFGN